MPAPWPEVPRRAQTATTKNTGPTGASRLGSLNPAMRYLILLVLTVLAACARLLEAHQLKVPSKTNIDDLRRRALLLDLPIRELQAAARRVTRCRLVLSRGPAATSLASESIDVSSDDETLTAKLDGLGTLTAEIVADGHAKVTWAAEQGNLLDGDRLCSDEAYGFGAQTRRRSSSADPFVGVGAGDRRTTRMRCRRSVGGRRHSTHIPVAATVTSGLLGQSRPTPTPRWIRLEQADAAIELHEATVRSRFDGPSPMEALKRFTGWVVRCHRHGRRRERRCFR